jgi:hypothetical protein
MTVLVTADIPGGTPEKDEALAAEMRSRENPPVGLLFRAAGPIPGGWRITSVWRHVMRSTSSTKTGSWLRRRRSGRSRPRSPCQSWRRSDSGHRGKR